MVVLGVSWCHGVVRHERRKKPLFVSKTWRYVFFCRGVQFNEFCQCCESRAPVGISVVMHGIPFTKPPTAVCHKRCFWTVASGPFLFCFWRRMERNSPRSTASSGWPRGGELFAAGQAKKTRLWELPCRRRWRRPRELALDRRRGRLARPPWPTRAGMGLGGA